ncbi:hypothetical protein AHF37_04875 [Paragonimus kellicotti]|nr:hypothetical protein AHF37_04875 [Paragonimus kellicotti]
MHCYYVNPLSLIHLNASTLNHFVPTENKKTSWDLIRKIEDKELELLRKDAEVYKREAAFRNDLVDKAETWYLKHEKRYMNTVKLVGKEMLSRVEFNLAMRHMNAPFDDIELYVLYEMLGPNKMGEVEFVKLAEVILQQYVAKDSMENTLSQMPSEDSHMWLLLTFRIPSLDAFDTTLTFEAEPTI